VSLVKVGSLTHHYSWILGTVLELRPPDMHCRAKSTGRIICMVVNVTYE